jgi:hypothetical protein
MSWLSICLVLLVGVCCVHPGLGCTGSGPSTVIRTAPVPTTTAFTPVAGNQLLLFPVRLATTDVGAQISSISALVEALDGEVALGVYTNEAVPKLLVQAGPIVADPGPRGPVSFTLNADKEVDVPAVSSLLLAIATVNGYNISSAHGAGSYHQSWALGRQGKLPLRVNREKPLSFIGSMEATLCR